jgi:predicted dehydrogenase
MNLTPEQEILGRRNFLKVLAGTPALALLGGAAAVQGPVRGGPVRLAFIGVGGQGRVLLEQVPASHGHVVALCDINPAQLAKADAVLAKNQQPPARHYAEWKELLQKEDLEGVVVATPLWLHAEVVAGCLEAGKHVLCEKMMAWDPEGCARMADAAHKADRVLEIGYQRFYNPVYHAAYSGIVKAGTLGDVYHARLAWHRNASWRRKVEPPAPDYDPSKWGYPTLDHLINWRLYWKYSKGLYAELASHQVSVVSWFFDAHPEAVHSTGGVFRFKDREVYDHVYSTFEYPGGRTATFSSIESNAFDHYYEMFMGTKGTLILRGETEAYLFEEGGGERPTGIQVDRKGGGPVLDASESRVADAAGARAARPGAAGQPLFDRLESYKREIAGFCGAVRVRSPLQCGPERATLSARSCILANEAVGAKARLTLKA